MTNCGACDLGLPHEHVGPNTRPTQKFFFNDRSEEYYKELITNLVCGYAGMISDGVFDHELVYEIDGDGWNEPQSETFSCHCGEWEGFDWIQTDPACSGRPDLITAAFLWLDHIRLDVYGVDDGDVSQDSNPV
jgi:hypothetical protein